MKKVFLFMAFLLGMNMTAGAQTATDYYLDVANGYSTIGDVGNKDDYNYLKALYLFTTYDDKGYAWLTMPVYGAYMAAKNRDKQQNYWIEISEGTHNIYTYASTNRWINSGNGSYPFMGSNSYFDKPGNTTRWGTNSTSTNKSQRMIKFYVSNTDQVRIWGDKGNASTGYPTTIKVFECTKNADGSLTRLSSDEMAGNIYSSSSGNINFTADLETSKYYEIECFLYRSNLAEICFRTPLNPAVITADPTSLSFTTTKGTPVTETVNVKGVNLKDVISATVTNSEGNAFSIDNTSISIDDASSSDGGNITVTFNPSEEGDYSGKLTLTTPSAPSVEIPLTGSATSRVFKVNISSVGLTTLYLDEPLFIPYDKYDPDLLGVYYIYAMNGTEMRAARLNNTIPANTAVIIQGNSGSYDFPVIGEADPLPSSRPNSYLSGCLVNTPVADVIAATPGTVYTLGKGSDHYINFYKYTGTTLNANKAYYLLPSGNSAKALTLSFDDAESEVTGINTVGAKAENGAWYSIQGVQLQGKPATKGIYIHNGKAVIVK